MTNQPLALEKFVPPTSRRSRRATTLLAQMADLQRGERIKTLREERHLTQPAVAEAVGVTLRAYQAWESTGGLRWENAKKLAKFFRVDAHYLWSGEEHSGKTPDVMGSLNGDTPQLDRIEEKLDRVLAILEGTEGLAEVSHALEALAVSIDTTSVREAATGT